MFAAGATSDIGRIGGAGIGRPGRRWTTCLAARSLPGDYSHTSITSDREVSRVARDWARRWWRGFWPGRHNPLVRRGDRIRAAVVLGAVLLALGAVPVAAMIGSSSYAGRIRAAGEQRAEHHQAAATLLGGASVAGIAAPSERRGRQATVRWNASGGTASIARGAVPTGSRAGDTVTIWFDPAGHAVPPPQTPAEVSIQAIGLGLALWSGVVAVLAGAVAYTHRLLQRRRYADWERQWARLNRHRSQP